MFIKERLKEEEGVSGWEGSLARRRDPENGDGREFQGCQVSCATRMWHFGPISGPRASRAGVLQGGAPVKPVLGPLDHGAVVPLPPVLQSCQSSWSVRS